MDFYHFFPPPIFWLKVCSRSVCWKYVNKQVKRRWFCWRTLEYGYFDILKRNKFKNKSKKIYFFLDGLAIKKTTFSAAFLWDIHFYFKILNQTKILPSICEKKSSWSRLHFFLNICQNHWYLVSNHFRSHISTFLKFWNFVLKL